MACQGHARPGALHAGGLALGPRGNLLVGCSDDAVAAGFKAVSLLLDPVSGKILRTFHQVGGSDEVWFDSARGDFVLAAVANPGGAVLGVIDARRPHWVENIPSGRRAHSVNRESRQSPCLRAGGRGRQDVSPRLC